MYFLEFVYLFSIGRNRVLTKYLTEELGFHLDNFQKLFKFYKLFICETREHSEYSDKATE